MKTLCFFYRATRSNLSKIFCISKTNKIVGQYAKQKNKSMNESISNGLLHVSYLLNWLLQFEKRIVVVENRLLPIDQQLKEKPQREKIDWRKDRSQKWISSK